jgi:hypothetical protein
LTEKCPECGYIMKSMYVNITNSKGKRIFKTIDGSKICFKCKVEKPSKEIRIIV